MKILCFFGIHQYQYFRKYGEIFQWCASCKRVERWGEDLFLPGLKGEWVFTKYSTVMPIELLKSIKKDQRDRKIKNKDPELDFAEIDNWISKHVVHRLVSDTTNLIVIYPNRENVVPDKDKLIERLLDLGFNARFNNEPGPNLGIEIRV